MLRRRKGSNPYPPPALVVGLAGSWFFRFRRSCDLRLRNEPLHLVSGDLLFGDTAGLARSRFDHRVCAVLQLACAARGYENVAIVAVESVMKLHRSPPD